MAISDKARMMQLKVRNNKYKTFGIYAAVVAMFLIGFIGVLMYVNAYKKEVDVVSFNKDMSSGELVEEVLMTKKTISSRDYEDGMVKWSNRNQYIGKYTANFIRRDTVVYKDMFAEEQPLKTPYLYKLDSDEELLTFPYNISEAGGKLVTPGDRLRIRGSYVVKGNPNDPNDDKVVSDIIFDVVEVQDLLNSSNESIVDIINEANRLPKKDRDELMKSEDFINKITPRAILMVVKTKDVNKYVQFQANENPNYTITLLTRNPRLKSSELNTGNSLLQLLQKVKESQGNNSNE